MNKKTIFTIMLFSCAAFISFLASCTKDPVDNNNNTTVTPASAPYIIVNGKKFVCAKPKSLKVSVTGGGTDSGLIWSGTGIGDTTLNLYHGNGRIKAGIYTIDSIGFAGPGMVGIGISWGSNIGSWSLAFAKGTYEIKKENGKWVSYLKNGEAWDQKVGKSARYKNIEFKAVWPF